MISDNIKNLRKEKGLTQKELADLLHVTSQAVSRWEKGDVEPSVETLNNMAKIFNVSIDELCNQKLTTKYNSENETCFATATTIYNKKLTYDYYLQLYRKNIIINIVIIILSAMSFLSVLLDNKIQSINAIYPLIFIFVFIIYSIVLFLNIRKKVNENLTKKKLVKTDYFFYDDYFEICNDGNDSNLTLKKDYSDIKNIKLKKDNIYIIFEGNVLFIINTNSISDNKNKVLTKLNINTS